MSFPRVSEPPKFVWAGGVKVPKNKADALRQLYTKQPKLAGKLAGFVNNGCDHSFKPSELKDLQDGGFVSIEEKKIVVDAYIEAILRFVIEGHDNIWKYNWCKLDNLPLVDD